MGLRTLGVLGRGAGARPIVRALTSSPARAALLRAAGATPLGGDLDVPRTLERLAGIATHVLHLAPPPGQGAHDRRTQALLRALRRAGAPRALVYVSTSGVYGDCAGAWVAETRPLAPATARAQRRVDAERLLRAWGRTVDGPRTSVLRVPGIYAADRGQLRARLERGEPVLRREDDVYVSHIHADDLARACALALWRGRPQRVLHVSDASALRMGDYFDQVADYFGLPRPPRIPRAQAQQQLGPVMWGFLQESRRLVAQRLARELRLVLRYPTVADGLRAQ